MPEVHQSTSELQDDTLVRMAFDWIDTVTAAQAPKKPIRIDVSRHLHEAGVCGTYLGLAINADRGHLQGDNMMLTFVDPPAARSPRWTVLSALRVLADLFKTNDAVETRDSRRSDRGPAGRDHMKRT